MTLEKTTAGRLTWFWTEDWLAVIVGLGLVALVLAGIVKHIP